MALDTGKSPRDTRVELVEEHIRNENAHDLEAVMETFSEAPYYDDEPRGEHHVGLGAVRVLRAALQRRTGPLHRHQKAARGG